MFVGHGVTNSNPLSCTPHRWYLTRPLGRAARPRDMGATIRWTTARSLPSTMAFRGRYGEGPNHQRQMRTACRRATFSSDVTLRYCITVVDLEYAGSLVEGTEHEQDLHRKWFDLVTLDNILVLALIPFATGQDFVVTGVFSIPRGIFEDTAS